MKLSFTTSALVLTFAAVPALADSQHGGSPRKTDGNTTSEARCMTCPAPEAPDPEPAPERGMAADEYRSLSHRSSDRCGAFLPPANWQRELYDAFAIGLLSKEAYWWGHGNQEYPVVANGRVIAVCHAPSEAAIPFVDRSTEPAGSRPPPKEPTDPVLLVEEDGDAAH